VPLRERAHQIGLTPKIIHDKGGPVVLASGRIRASDASCHCVGYEGADRETSAQANQRIGEILKALGETEMGKLIASGAVEAEIDLAAFRGQVAWEDELDGVLVEAARAANVGIVVEHNDKFTDEGVPLAVRL